VRFLGALDLPLDRGREPRQRFCAGYTLSAGTQSYRMCNAIICSATTGRKDWFGAVGTRPSHGSSRTVTIVCEQKEKGRAGGSERKQGQILVKKGDNGTPSSQEGPGVEIWGDFSRARVESTVPITVVLLMLLPQHLSEVCNRRNFPRIPIGDSCRAGIAAIPGGYRCASVLRACASVMARAILLMPSEMLARKVFASCESDQRVGHQITIQTKDAPPKAAWQSLPWLAEKPSGGTIRLGLVLGNRVTPREPAWKGPWNSNSPVGRPNWKPSSSISRQKREWRKLPQCG
jgi:hypothetical protein